MPDEEIEMPEEPKGIPLIWILIGGAVLWYILNKNRKPGVNPPTPK